MRSLRYCAGLLVMLALAACASSSTGTSVAGADGAALPAPDLAAAERLISSDETLQVVDFPVVGSTSLNGRVEVYRSVSYAVPVAQGRRLEVELRSPSSRAYFNIHDAADDSGAAVFNGNSGARIARLTAPRDMTYVIRPFQPRASARLGESFD